MYWSHYVQESVYGKDPVASTYGYNCQNNTFNVTVGGWIGDLTYQKVWTEKYFNISN
jgi:hypothetical protein